MKPIALVCPKIPPSRDGVGDYTYYLASELARSRPVAIITSQRDLPPHHPAVSIHHWDGNGLGTLLPLLKQIDPAFINVQWVPFLWGRWGINVSLPYTVLRLRRAGYRIVTTVHEPYVPFAALKTWPMAVIQRLELWVLILASNKIAVSISAWTRMLQAQFFWRHDDIFWLPVGSNIPRLAMTAAERDALRHELGARADDLLVAMFNPAGTGKMVALAAKAWSEIQRARPSARLLLIGSEPGDAASRTFAQPNRVQCTGYVDAARVSQLLTCADLCLAPYIDGISSRRGSTIAAIAHGLPVVTTTGDLTDHRLFEGSPLLLAAVGDQDEFVARAVALACDGGQRQALHQQLTTFHDRHFAWPSIAAPLVAAADA